MNLKPVDQLIFLVDVNLPKKFSYFNSIQFAHVVDIDPLMKDKALWDYALANQMIILSKDADFYELFLVNENCPKVVNFRIGNLTLKELHQYFIKFWPYIVEKLDQSQFIIADLDKITIIK
jgi:predicted nuclease of predicted toxin-antitoxin system